MAALIARAKAAPFGAGKKTKLDPRVRDGLTIRVEPGVSVVGFEPKKDGVLAEVQRTLTPDDDAPLEAELHAVNSIVREATSRRTRTRRAASAWLERSSSRCLEGLARRACRPPQRSR